MFDQKATPSVAELFAPVVNLWKRLVRYLQPQGIPSVQDKDYPVLPG